MKRKVVYMLVCFAVAGAQAAVFVWDGGASTSSFGDAANWNPDGTTFDGG